MTSSSAAPGGGDGGVGVSVLQHHNSANRSGVYLDTAFSNASVRQMKRDATLNPTIVGAQFSQPLYVESGPGGKGTFYVVTESNNVYAIDETTGATVWAKNMGPAAASTGLVNANQPLCGNIFPLGVTGTPVIDLGRRRLYLDNVLATAPTGGTIKTHAIHSLSLDDGSEETGWPVDTSPLKAGSLAFDPVAHNQRGALLILGGTLYVPYGGHIGDCAHNGVYYHGWVVGIPLANPAGVTAWATGAERAGVWAPGGIASDGTHLFLTTGNGGGGNETATTPYEQQNAILRMQAGPAFSGQTADYFAPHNWVAEDNGDVDICGSGVLPVDVPGATPSQVAVALGKDGIGYVVDRSNLGGIGPASGAPPVAQLQLTTSTGGQAAEIIGAPAWYSTAKGVYVVFSTNGGAQALKGCPTGQSGNLGALKLGATSPPTLALAWCQNSHGAGSPSVTIAGSDTLVWTVGTGGDMHLHAFDGDLGTPVYTSTETMSAQHWTVPIAVHGRIVVGGNNALYAFK